MKKSISVNKKSRGRPKKAGGVYPVSAVRLPPGTGAAVDKWAAAQSDKPTRSEAIRRLVVLGLGKSAPTVAVTSPAKVSAERAKELAGKTIDRLTDSTASADTQAGRKRRLVKGPKNSRTSDATGQIGSEIGTT